MAMRVEQYLLSLEKLAHLIRSQLLERTVLQRHRCWAARDETKCLKRI